MILSNLLFTAYSCASPSQITLIAPSGQLDVDVYCPDFFGKSAVVFLHGFMSSKDHHRETAMALAAEGFTVVVPNLEYGLWESNHAERAGDVRHILLRLREGHFTETSLAKTVLIGHSVGGLMVLFVALDE